MVLADKDSDLDKIGENIYQPILPFKYSRAANWILLKPLNVKNQLKIRYFFNESFNPLIKCS